MAGPAVRGTVHRESRSGHDARRAGGCCAACRPITSTGSLWGVLAPALVGRTVVDLAGRTPEGLLRAAQGGDVLLATPFLWARLGQAGPELPQGVAGVTSGAPSDKDTWAASRALGLIRLTEVYGASETGGVGMRTAEDAPFALMPDIRRQAQDLWRPGAPAPLPLQDDLAWISPTDFTVQGRKDHMVQVGGINVSPTAVARALEDSGLAQEAAVRLEGDRLKAFVVPASPAPADLETALRQAVAHMPAPARPTRFTFGAALPRSATARSPQPS
jgi:Acyl-CoA synthetases (AMP-forming)/AMP-acid ligases II